MTEVLLSGYRLHKSFAGLKVLNGVSLALAGSTLTGLVGPSGAGKSTLLKILGGVMPPDQGKVQMGERGISDVALMFQEGALFDSLSVFDNVAFPLVAGAVPAARLPAKRRRAIAEPVMEILGRVGLAKAAQKLPAQLSGGMRRRASLARALVERPRVLLLDDPTAGLDPVASSVIMELIVELQQEYQPATVVVSHDLRRLLPVVDRLIGLFHGELIFDGSVADLGAAGETELYRFASCRYDFTTARSVN